MISALDGLLTSNQVSYSWPSVRKDALYPGKLPSQPNRDPAADSKSAFPNKTTADASGQSLPRAAYGDPYGIDSAAINKASISNSDQTPVGGKANATQGSDALDKSESKNGDNKTGGKSSENKANGGSELSEEEKQQVAKLKARDLEVRAHEAAHMAAAGGYAGGASYSYQQGPDGNSYAIGGEVSIDTSALDDPEATAQKMKIVRAAAMAPANPSGQDYAVAASAMQAEMKAGQEAADAKKAETTGEGKEQSGANQTDGIQAGSIPAADDARQSEESNRQQTTVRDAAGIMGLLANFRKPQSQATGSLIDLVA